jgi:hypothetical protein
VTSRYDQTDDGRPQAVRPAPFTRDLLTGAGNHPDRMRPDTCAARIVTRVKPANTWSRVLSAAALVLASTAFAGCGSGSDDTPAVCTSIASLKSSVGAITDEKIDRNTLTTLPDKVDQVRSDLSTVRKDAKDEYATEVDAIETAASDFRTSLDAAVATPSVQSVAAVVTAAQALGTSLKSLNKAVKGTC